MDQKTYTWEFFCKSLTPGLRRKIESVISSGISLCLVGGASRQWIQNQTLPFDLDFEMRPEGNKKVSDLLFEIFGNVRPMPFHVFIIEMTDMGHVFQLEFSLPRKEIYGATTPAQGFGHSDFDVQVDPKMTYDQSFKRRDFSLNAVGLELKLGPSGLMLIVQDPYHGVEDLAAKVLRPISDDFYKDPVRFLRMIRFQISLGLALDPTLMQNLGKFNLQSMTLHYVLKEAFKTDFLAFMKLFFQYIHVSKLNLPNFLQNLQCLNLLSPTAVPPPRNPLELAVAIAESPESERRKILEQVGKNFEEQLGLKGKTIQKLILAKKSEEVIIKLQQRDSSLQKKLSDDEFFQHPLVRELALVLKGHTRYPDIFEARWTFLKKDGHELQVIKQLSLCMAGIELPTDCVDKVADRDLRKLMLALRALGLFPRIAGL
ncbi:MAG: hypothetical protein A2X86_11565 [Bdellovibrionales bacterium GWA2_49_15]|nr:MAG: hypothetical protein A2X86_11565 [Bdellovibrionales bacterium GWA2_49_15]HAZ12611.1 hypothetical protein [Bdellovibrionales bacterium]